MKTVCKTPANVFSLCVTAKSLSSSSGHKLCLKIVKQMDKKKTDPNKKKPPPRGIPLHKEGACVAGWWPWSPCSILLDFVSAASCWKTFKKKKSHITFWDPFMITNSQKAAHKIVFSLGLLSVEWCRRLAAFDLLPTAACSLWGVAFHTLHKSTLNPLDGETYKHVQTSTHRQNTANRPTAHFFFLFFVHLLARTKGPQG